MNAATLAGRLGSFGAGTPAEAFCNALDAAYQSFDAAGQAGYPSDPSHGREGEDWLV